MREENYEPVKALVETWDEEWGCGPYEDCLPEAEELRRLNELTGRNWKAEDVRDVCFEFSAHNSLEETVYFLLHGEYPPVYQVRLVFYRPKPGAALDPKAVYEKYRFGGKMKALEKLPYEYIRWIGNRDEIDVEKIQGTSDMKRIKDLKDNPLLLFVNSWSVGMVLDRNPGLVLEEFGRS